MMNNRIEKESIQISFIVPFWSVEKYFDDCLRSLQSQVGDDIEFLLIDDCSPDRSIDIARKYADYDDRFRIIRNSENRGVGGSRNVGIDNARGQYVWFVDSDDIIPENVSSDLVSKATVDELDILYFNYERDLSEGFRANEQKQIKGVLSGYEEIADNPLIISGFIYHHLFHSYTASNKLWRLDFLKNNDCLFPEKTHFEDNVSTLWMLNSKRIGYIDKFCYIHRIRAKSITTKNRVPSEYEHHIRVSRGLNKYSDKIDLSKLSHRSILLTKNLQILVFNGWLIKCYKSADSDYKKFILKQCSDAILEIPVLDDIEAIKDACSFFKYKFGSSDLRKSLLSKSSDEISNALQMIFEGSNKVSFKKILRYLKPYGIMEG